MEDKMVAIKAAFAAFFYALGAFLGWKGIMGIVWVAAMLLDYISGTAAACKSGEWCSATARQGLWHKGGMILVVVVAAIADGVMAVICQHLPPGRMGEIAGAQQGNALAARPELEHGGHAVAAGGAGIFGMNMQIGSVHNDLPFSKKGLYSIHGNLSKGSLAEGAVSEAD